MGDDLVKRARHNALSDMPHYASVELIEALADRIEELEAKLDWVITERDETFALMLDRAQTAEAKLAKAVEAVIDAGASLAAAISLLEKGGKKAAPSNKMFDQMLADYRNSLERTRTTLAELTGGKDD